MEAKIDERNKEGTYVFGAQKEEKGWEIWLFT